VNVASGAVIVKAISAMTAEASGDGKLGGGLTVSVMLPTSTTTGTTRVSSARTSTLRRTPSTYGRRENAPGDVQCRCDRFPSGWRIGAQRRPQLAGLSTRSWWLCTELTTTGRIAVLGQTEDAKALANAYLGGGGILDVAGGRVTSTEAGSTHAYLRNGTRIIQAGSLSIQADSKDTAGAKARVKSGGGISGRGMKAATVIRPTTMAYVGDNVTIQALTRFAWRPSPGLRKATRSPRPAAEEGSTSASLR